MTTLITLDDYKEYASINSIDFDDRIQSIVTRVSELVKTYCGRKFIDYYNKATQQFTQVGVSAQSLREVLPDAVRECDDGTLAVVYGNAALVACIELAKEVVALRAEIEALKAQG